MKAIVIGATGLVGGKILATLLEDTTFSEVRVLTRRVTGLAHPKLKEILVDYHDIESWGELITGDVLFSALGTTIQVAGSQAAQYRVDFHYQLTVARLARAQGVSRLVLISSTGANSGSPFFYLRMKGELEAAVKWLNFSSTTILRPGPLHGKRETIRVGETVASAVLGVLPKLRVLSKFLPVSATQVAKKAVIAAKSGIKVQILEASAIYF